MKLSCLHLSGESNLRTVVRSQLYPHVYLQLLLLLSRKVGCCFSSLACFWLTDPQGKVGLKTTSAGSQGYVLDRSVPPPPSRPAAFRPLSAGGFQSKAKRFQLVWWFCVILIPSEKHIASSTSHGMLGAILVGGVGHDWTALAEMCGGGAGIPMWPGGQKWRSWQILARDRFWHQIPLSKWYVLAALEPSTLRANSLC